MPHPKIRPCTAADLGAYFPDGFPWSTRAVVADLDGEILGVGGVYYSNRIPIVFSDFREKLRDYPMTLARGVKEIMKIVQNKPCFAIVDGRFEEAPKLLGRLGFVQVREGVFQWPIQ